MLWLLHFILLKDVEGLIKIRSLFLKYGSGFLNGNFMRLEINESLNAFL